MGVSPPGMCTYAVKQPTAKIQCSQMVECLFAIRSSGQAAKRRSRFLTLVTAVTAASMGVSSLCTIVRAARTNFPGGQRTAVPKLMGQREICQKERSALRLKIGSTVTNIRFTV